MCKIVLLQMTKEKWKYPGDEAQENDSASIQVNFVAATWFSDGELFYMEHSFNIII